MASPAFERFRFSFFEDPDSPRNGVHGLPDDSKDPQHMMYRVMSDDAERHEGGKRDILAAIAGWPISAQ